MARTQKRKKGKRGLRSVRNHVGTLVLKLLEAHPYTPEPTGPYSYSEPYVIIDAARQLAAVDKELRELLLGLEINNVQYDEANGRTFAPGSTPEEVVVGLLIDLIQFLVRDNDAVIELSTNRMLVFNDLKRQAGSVRARDEEARRLASLPTPPRPAPGGPPSGTTF